MPVLRCTQKLLKELRVSNDDLVDESESSGRLGDWYANLLRIERRKCVMFTNAATLYTFLVAGVLRKDFDRVGDLFRTRLRRTLTHDGYSANDIDLVLEEYGTMFVGRTRSRRVLGSMNDFVWAAETCIWEKGGLQRCDLEELNRWLNESPMSLIGYDNGERAMREKVSTMTG